MTSSKKVIPILFALGFSASSYGSKTHYYYDSLGRLKEVESSLTGDAVYHYDDAGNRTSVNIKLPPSDIQVNYTWSIESNFLLGEYIKFNWTSDGETCGGSISPGSHQGNIQLTGTTNSVSFQPSATQQRATLTCLSPGKAAKTINSTFEDGCSDC